MKQRLLTYQIFRFAMIIALASVMIVPALANKDRKRDAARGNTAVDVDNFGQVNDHIYRGAQPKGDHFRQLAALGVKTILDLRGDPERHSRANAERAGLRYINLPLEPKQYPQADAATRFLEIVNNQANWPVYVHCAGGRHRTGVMLAVYRMTMDHWTIDQAYHEMKQYDFYTFGGHSCFKEYIFDFSRNLAQQPSKPIEVTSDQQSEKQVNSEKPTSNDKPESSEKQIGSEKNASSDSGSSLKDLPMDFTKKLFSIGKNITTFGKGRKSD